MAITEYAIGAAAIDVSNHSGFLEVLEGQVRRIQQNTNMGPYATSQIIHPFADEDSKPKDFVQTGANLHNGATHFSRLRA